MPSSCPTPDARRCTTLCVYVSMPKYLGNSSYRAQRFCRAVYVSRQIPFSLDPRGNPFGSTMTHCPRRRKSGWKIFLLFADHRHAESSIYACELFVRRFRINIALRKRTKRVALQRQHTEKGEWLGRARCGDTWLEGFVSQKKFELTYFESTEAHSAKHSLTQILG